MDFSRKWIAAVSELLSKPASEITAFVLFEGIEKLTRLEQVACRLD